VLIVQIAKWYQYHGSMSASDEMVRKNIILFNILDRQLIFLLTSFFLVWLDETPYMITDDMTGFVAQEVQISEGELKRVENSNPSEELYTIDEEIQTKRENGGRFIDASNQQHERSNSDDEANQFFDGCYIYLSGFTESQNIRIKNVILSGGGVRWPTMDSKVTHFIVGSTINQKY